MREIQQPTTDERGYQTHPAFGTATVMRPSGLGSVLFQSDIKHQHTVTLTIAHADRKRDLNRDWVHSGKQIIEIEMSQAQWAELVASGGIGGGVPVTIRQDASGLVPGLPYQPRTEASRQEVANAVQKMLGDLVEKVENLKSASDSKAGVKAMREAIRQVDLAVAGAANRAVFATQSMEEAIETMVANATADINATIADAAARKGLDASEFTAPAITSTKEDQ